MFKAITKRKSFCAGESVVLKLEYRHDTVPVDAGGLLLVGYHTGDGAGKIQSSEPDAANYVWFDSDSEAKLSLTAGNQRHSLTPFPGTTLGDMLVFEIKVASGTLQPGDTVTLHFGDFMPGKSAESPLKFYYQLILPPAASATGHLIAAEPPAPYGGQPSRSAVGEDREWMFTGVKLDVVAGETGYRRCPAAEPG